MRHACELVLHHQLRPANRSDPADAREIVALEIDDHHVLGCVLCVLDVLADRSSALDRHRPEPLAATGEKELGRRGHDRPAVPDERAWVERTQRCKRGGEACRVAVEAGGEVLDEVDLVDVAARDRRPHLADSLGVVLRRPRRFPLPDPEGRSRRTLVGDRGTDPGCGNGQRARLGRRGPRFSPQCLRQAVTEVDVGDEPLVQSACQVLLERLERVLGLPELKHRRSVPRGAGSARPDRDRRQGHARSRSGSAARPPRRPERAPGRTRRRRSRTPAAASASR